MIFWLLTACAQDPMELALKEEPGAVNVMHGFTSSDLQTWKHEGIIAWGVASLGMAIDTDGSLLVTAIQEVRPPTWWEENIGNPPVRGYKFDGNTWAARSWKVDDKESRSYIDPQMFEGQLWYITPESSEGDPAELNIMTPIRSSNPGLERYVGYKLADPSPVRFKGELHVFATQGLHILHAKGDPLNKVMVHPNQNDIFYKANVPYVLQVENEIWLLGQTMIGGRRLPVISKSNDAQTWSDWKPLGDIPRSLKNCTSPVLGPHPNGGWLMLCIEELLH